MKDQTYTPARASAIAKLPLKAVHKLIEGGLIRPRRLRTGREVQRLLSHEQLVYLRLEAKGLRLLPLATRREIAKTIETSPHADTVVVSEGPALVIQVKAARQEVKHGVARLGKAQQMVV